MNSELTNVIDSINYAYDQDYFYFEQYYDDKYGKERATSLLSFDKEWKKAKQQILQGQKLIELVEELREGCKNSSDSDVFSNSGKQYMKDLAHELGILLEQSKQQFPNEVSRQ